MSRQRGEPWARHQQSWGLTGIVTHTGKAPGKWHSLPLHGFRPEKMRIVTPAPQLLWEPHIKEEEGIAGGEVLYKLEVLAAVGSHYLQPFRYIKPLQTLNGQTLSHSF